MKNAISLSLFILFTYTGFSQKVTILVTKSENAALSEWKILDEKYNQVISGKDYYRNDSVYFSLEDRRRYILAVSVSEIFVTDTTFYSLSINGEPVILVDSDMGTGTRFYSFFTGIRGNDTKITGGTTADISDFPWQVYFIAGDYRCGGSIIGDNWILTAAHCTKNNFGTSIPASEMSVRVGTNNPFNTLDGRTYLVSQVIVNEGFDSQTLNNDIALLRLAEPINYPNAVPIKLITSEDVAYGATDPGVFSWVSGWGLTSINPKVFPTRLQKVQLPIVSNAQASTVWRTIPPTDIMAGYLNGNRDACNGDSGGPMVVPVFDEYKLAGIVSWGSTNCNTYGAYTRVSALEDWIRAKTGIAKEYRLPVPVGDTIVCQGQLTSNYSVDNLPQATNYEWRITPSDAGSVSGNSANATVIWNTDFSGPVTIIVRATINNIVSEWSRLILNVVLNTKIISQTPDTVVCADQPVTLKTEAIGYNLIYKWYKNGLPVQSGQSALFHVLSSTVQNSGDYECIITGSCGIVSSGIIKLTVHPLTQITGVSPDVAESFGNDLTLQVNAEGHDLLYRWQKNDIIIENSNSPELFLPEMNASDIGLYRATVYGTCGNEISDTIYVYVKKEGFTGFPEVFLWPSVTTNEFHVALSNDALYTLHVINSAGQVVREMRNCRYQTTVNVSALSKGIYIVSVRNMDFRKSLKLIKH